MFELYVYNIATREHVATVIGGSLENCEINAISLIFGRGHEYDWTTTPNFGQPNGLIATNDAVVFVLN